MSQVAIVGSLHLDILVEAPRLPSSDETLAGKSWTQKCGGKGGNQAVAAARFGARAAMGGRVGDDDFGRRLRENLRAAGVDDACVATDATSGSGMSVAILEASGEYGAVIVSGANLAIDPAAITRGWAALWHSAVLLLQNEVPEAVNRAAAQPARQQGRRAILTAAPAPPPAPAPPDVVDILVVNRVEAAVLSGLPVGTRAETEAAARALQHPGRDLIITMGREGLLLADRAGTLLHQPAFPARQLSSHGAGDCFCGALAARLALGEHLERACEFARMAAALYVAATPVEQAALNARQVLAGLDKMDASRQAGPR